MKIQKSKCPRTIGNRKNHWKCFYSKNPSKYNERHQYQTNQLRISPHHDTQKKWRFICNGRLKKK